jgi:hypothetical protein
MIKRYPFPVKLDTSNYRLFWNDAEVSEVEYAKLEQEAIDYNNALDRAKAELELPVSKKKKK